MAKLCMIADMLMGQEGVNLSNWWEFIDLDAEREDSDRLKLVHESGQTDEPFASDLFILLEGNYFLEIVKQAKNVEKICTISGTDFGLQNQSIMLKNKNILIAAVDTDSPHSADVVELLRPYVEIAKNVVTISTKSMVDFRAGAGDGPRDVTFVRGINSKFSYIKELQAPNMISGVAAGIASWRSFKKLPVESYVFFVRQILLDEESTKKVLKLLQALNTGDIFDYKPKGRQPSSLFL